MRFELLGSMRVFDHEDAELPIRRPKVRSLLAVLLLHPNSPVPAYWIAEALREDGTRVDGSVLRTHVWWLRKSLTESRVRSVSRGYLLEVRPDELDVERFRKCVVAGRRSLDEGDFRGAAGLFVRAEALWSDPPLVDLPHSAEISPLMEALLDERQIAQELLIDARLALGEHRELLSSLRIRAAENPQDERVCEQLLRALWGSGRKSEAFDAYTRLRKVLVDEYGASPGARLQRLYQQILCEDA